MEEKKHTPQGWLSFWLLHKTTPTGDPLSLRLQLENPQNQCIFLAPNREMAMGFSKAKASTPSERDPIQPQQIGSKMGGSPTNQNGIPLVLTHSQISFRRHLVPVPQHAAASRILPELQGAAARQQIQRTHRAHPALQAPAQGAGREDPLMNYAKELTTLVGILTVVKWISQRCRPVSGQRNMGLAPVLWNPIRG